jgi:hypothetical protein
MRGRRTAVEANGKSVSSWLSPVVDLKPGCPGPKPVLIDPITNLVTIKARIRESTLRSKTAGFLLDMHRRVWYY